MSKGATLRAQPDAAVAVANTDKADEKEPLDTFTVTLPVAGVYCDTNQRYHGLMLGPGRIRFKVYAADTADLADTLNEMFSQLAEQARLRLRARRNPTRLRGVKKVRTDDDP